MIEFVEVTSSASHGVNLISPSGSINLRGNDIRDSLGVGVNIASLSGEGRESDESSFTPLKQMNIPYNLFGLLDICDTNKEIRVEERVLVYYKYDNHPVNCVKIFRSAYNVKPLGLRFLQFNLFNSSVVHGKLNITLVLFSNSVLPNLRVLFLLKIASLAGFRQHRKKVCLMASGSDVIFVVPFLLHVN